MNTAFSPSIHRPARGTTGIAVAFGRAATPTKLKMLLGAIWLGVLLLWAAVWAGTRAHRAALQDVSASAPGVIVAQSLKAQLSDMDANAVNQMLFAPKSANREAKEAARSFDSDRKAFAEALVSAAHSISRAEDYTPLTTLQSGSGEYQGLLARALLLHEQGQQSDAVAAYRQSQTLLKNTLLPAADALNESNESTMMRAYAVAGRQAAGASALTWLAGLLALGALVGAQVFAFSHSKRLLNIGLLGATLLGAGLLMWTEATFSAASSQLHRAQQDAFVSVVALSKTRALAFDANGDKSRWLLDPNPTRRAETLRAFEEKTSQIATFHDLTANDVALQIASPSTTYGIVADQIARPDSSYGLDGVLNLPPGFTGLLADAARNVSSPGESAACADMVRGYGRYLELDPQVRDLENRGRHADAVQLAITYDKNGSNQAFQEFDNGLKQALQITSNAFDGAMQNGLGALSNYELFSSLLCLAVAALAFTGIRSRLREYN